MCTGKDIFWDQNFCPVCKKHWVHCYCSREVIEEAWGNDMKEVDNEQTEQSLSEVSRQRA